MTAKEYFQKYNSKTLTIIFLIFFIPRLINLGSDIANFDSSYWYPRMDNFTKYLLRGEYKLTYQKYHPGVIMLWTSGTSKYVFEKTFESVFNYNPRYMPHQFTRMHFATKLPLVFFISVLGVAMFYLLSKIVNEKFALTFSIILSFEPFFLGVSRFLHLSALTAMLMFLSLLMLYYHYHSKRKDKKIFYLSAIILGLGTLTKIDAVITAPVNALLILYYELKDIKYDKENIINTILNMVKLEILYGLSVFITFYALFPSMWVAPVWTISKIIQDGIKDTAFSSSGADTLSGIKALFYPEMIIFRSLPTFVLGVLGGTTIVSIPKLFKKTKISKDAKVLFEWVILYIVFNILILTIPDKIKDRYLINLYPPLALIGTVFLYYALLSKIKLVKYGISGLFAFFYILTVYKYHPVYSFYYSELIGGPGGREKLGLPIKNRGEYYAQAALFINKHDDKPEIRNVVLSHREQIRTFGPFFLGETFTNPKLMKNGYKADYILTRPDFDYLVTDSPLAKKCKLIKTFGPREPLGYKIINLYKCNGVDNSYKGFTN